MSKYNEIIDRFPNFRIAVVGDIMLDRYVWGEATRISQEAPVPVVAVNRTNAVPGGAANVTRNLRSLGAGVVCLGHCGDDDGGKELRNLLADEAGDKP